MARERSPQRDKSFEIWKSSGGTMKLKDIAAELGVSDIQIRKWKNQDRWEEQLQQAKVTLPNRNSNVTNEKGNVTFEKVTKEVVKESFPGQCEAIGHKSGERCRNKALDGERFCRVHLDGWEGQCTATSKQTGERCKKKAEPGKNKCKFHGGKSTGPPPGSQNAVKHGFFARIFPDDEETRAIVSEIIEKSPLDILWEQIVIQYTAIARAQKIMFVKDQDDLTEVLKRQKESSGMQSDSWEKEWEFQFAWDKQAGFLKAQSTAMKTLEGLILRYEDMVERYELKGLVVEEHRLRIEKLKVDIEKAKGSGDDNDLIDEVIEEEGLIDG